QQLRFPVSRRLTARKSAEPQVAEPTIHSTTPRATLSAPASHPSSLRFDSRTVLADRVRASPGSCVDHASPLSAHDRLAYISPASPGSFRAKYFSCLAR